MEIVVRQMRAGDGPALAQIHAEMARYYETWTYHGSPLSLRFWTERMGYAERSVNLRKAL